MFCCRFTRRRKSCNSWFPGLDPQQKKKRTQQSPMFGRTYQVGIGNLGLPSELSPKSNCCKTEYLFILRFKGPLRFSMFGTRLSFKQFWLCLFLNGLRDFGCRALFWKPCVPARLYSIWFRPSVAARYSSRWKGLHVSTGGWTVFLILRFTRDCIFFPGKAHAANFRGNPPFF